MGFNPYTIVEIHLYAENRREAESRGFVASQLNEISRSKLYLQLFMEDIPQLFGLVLAGGKSRRMGTDKGSIAYHDKPQREYLFELLQSCCDQVYLSCYPGQDVPDSMQAIPDGFDIQSPLNGVLSAFQQHPSCAWLCVAIDLPNVAGDVLRELIARRDHTKVATCFFDSGAQAPEPLLTIWEPAAQPLLLQQVQGGNVSPRYFLQREHVQIVYGMNESVFVNVNDPVARASWLRQPGQHPKRD